MIHRTILEKLTEKRQLRLLFFFALLLWKDGNIFSRFISKNQCVVGYAWWIKKNCSPIVAFCFALPHTLLLLNAQAMTIWSIAPLGINFEAIFPRCVVEWNVKMPPYCCVPDSLPVVVGVISVWRCLLLWMLSSAICICYIYLLIRVFTTSLSHPPPAVMRFKYMNTCFVLSTATDTYTSSQEHTSNERKKQQQHYNT